LFLSEERGVKPDWKDAPEWAQWLARSSDGNWTWFEFEPELDDTGDYLQRPLTRYEEIDYASGSYIEERP
jgi:hypothetical protein